MAKQCVCGTCRGTGLIIFTSFNGQKQVLECLQCEGRGLIDEECNEKLPEEVDK